MSVEVEREGSSNANENWPRNLFGNKSGRWNKAGIRRKVLISLVTFLSGISIVLTIINWNGVEAKEIVPSRPAQEKTSRRTRRFNDKITPNADKVVKTA